jgi:2-hydroxy-3-keto-5-methylthiopentenyl-1-phosphate phosphatase
LKVKEPEFVEGQKAYAYEIFDSDIDSLESKVDYKQDSQVVENSYHSVNQFLKTILSKSSLLNHKTMFSDFNRAIIVEHDWWAVFNYPSIQLSRCLRWIGLCNDIMLTLLFDTLFFMVMYPPGVCEVVNTEELCNSIPGLTKSSQQCLWDPKTNLCSLAEPPGSFLFGAFVTLMVILLSLPFSIVMWGMLCGVVNCYPDLESIGLNCNCWLVKAAEPNDDNDNEDIATEENPPIPDDELFQMLFDKDFTVNDELEYILEEIKDFFEKNLCNKVFDKNLSNKIDAVCERMHMHADGTPFMGLKAYAKHGTCRNRIVNRITKARKSCSDILDSVEGVSDFQERDTLLCQSFILEHFTFFKRMCLSAEFYFNDNSPTSTCEPITWVLCWAYIWAIFALTCYWMIAWGSKAGTESFVFWGEMFIFAFLQVHRLIYVNIFFY